MRTKYMLLLSITAFIFCCASCRSSQNIPRKIDNHSIVPDSQVVVLLGDTICQFVYSPTEVIGYKMRPQKAEQDTLIAQYTIDYKIGELAASYYSILQFFLQDILNYDLSGSIVKTPFEPNIAIKFVDENKEELYLLVAFNGNQLAFVKDDKVYCRQQYVHARYLVKFALGLLPDNEYLKTLLKLP